MKGLFGIVGVLVALVVVGLLVKQQVRVASPAAAGMPAAATVREQSQQMQQRVQQDVQRALEQGAARASDAQ